MRIQVHEWMAPTAWFVAGIFATGAFWYFLSNKNYSAAVGSGIGAVVFACLAIYLHRSTDKSSSQTMHRERLSQYLSEAQNLRARLSELPLPVEAHNDWVDRASKYLRKNLGKDTEMRFSDFSGMMFYGDGSEKSKMSRSLEGRSRRLHEIIGELRP